jgi:hypothetical protein
MRKLIPENPVIFLTGLILFFISCTPQSCFEETESYLKASFYDNLTEKLLAPDSVTIYGLNMETNKLYNKALKYIIKINGIADTIRFRYSSYPHLVSKECGYTFYHRLDTEPKYTYNRIKYIFTGNSTITTINEENIRIFY